MILTWKTVRLRLKETFSISYGNFNFRDALLVKIQYGGAEGYGECIQISYYQIDLIEFQKILAQIKNLVETQQIIPPIRFYNFLLSLKLHPFLLSALDCAYWDLYGKLEKKSFAELAGISQNFLPDSSFTISIGNISEQIAKIDNSKWEIFKVKCNIYSAEAVELLLKTGKLIALDANASFSETECELLEKSSAGTQLLYVEQPMQIDHFYSLTRESAVNWMADEDCQDFDSLISLQKHYKSINIKLQKCGGITPALKLIQEAKKMGYQVMIGCMTESSVGISAGIALAPLCDFADLDGANLISNDYAKGSFVDNGKLVPAKGHGLGIHLVD